MKLNLESLSNFPETMIDLGPQHTMPNIDTFVQEEEIKESDPTEINQEKNDIEMLTEASSEVYYVIESEPRKVSPKKASKKHERKTKTPKKPTTLDLSFIERFATVWRCKICQKISSNKFLAMDHRAESHSVAMQLK